MFFILFASAMVEGWVGGGKIPKYGGTIIYICALFVCFCTPDVTPNKLLQGKKGMYSQHSMGLDDACRDTVLPVAWLMWTRNTILTRVFLRPMSVSPFLSSMSELRSFKIPAQSILCLWRQKEKSLPKSVCLQGKIMVYILSQLIRLWFIQYCSQIKRDFHSGLHHAAQLWQRLQSCQQKINTTTPNRAFTPQCIRSWVKFKLYRNKWLGTFIT